MFDFTELQSHAKDLLAAWPGLTGQTVIEDLGKQETEIHAALNQNGLGQVIAVPFPLEAEDTGDGEQLSILRVSFQVIVLQNPKKGTTYILDLVKEVQAALLSYSNPRQPRNDRYSAIGWSLDVQESPGALIYRVFFTKLCTA